MISKLYISVTLPFPHLMWAGTAMSLLSLSPLTVDVHIDLFNQDLVRSRSRAIAAFLASDADNCFLLDADVSIDGADIQKLIESPAQIVAAPYPKKHARLLMKALYALQDEVKEGRSAPLSGSRTSIAFPPLYDRTWIPSPQAEPDPSTKLLACDGVAMGATLIRRAAAQAIADDCEIEYLDEYTMPDGSPKRVPTKGVFMLEHSKAPSFFPEGTMHLYPEDYSFCRRARALGITPYVHTGTNARHAGVLAMPL